MTQVTLYNSLSRTKEVFTPINPDEVTMYSCGPTVYDAVHIGNLRAFIVDDLLQRIMRHVGGYRMRWVVNITDIDDKMIARARTTYPDDSPMDGLNRLATTFEVKFLEDLARVNVMRDDISELPHATDHITHMQAMITDLVAQGVAYIADGSVYFSLSEYEKRGHTYGKLVNVDYDPQTRIDDQEQKDGAGDFALWKAHKDSEPSWDFVLGDQALPGRPGWHIECSAMSTEYLGQEFDIHTGGVDLKFPHHENELAQSGGVLARYWVHNEHLTIDQEKMAKTVGNVTRLSDIDNPLAFRLAVVSSHYRSQMDFSDAVLHDAEQRLLALRILASKVVNNQSTDTTNLLEDIRHRFGEAIADDLGTPQALAILAELERATIYGQAAEGLLRDIDSILGLDLFAQIKPVKSGAVGMLLTERQVAREAQDWIKSDRLRDEILTHGVKLDDTPQGQIIWEDLKV